MLCSVLFYAISRVRLTSVTQKLSMPPGPTYQWGKIMKYIIKTR